jgi:hypothetical protein
MEQSFIIINNNHNYENNSFLKTYRRTELINSICNETELSHLTQEPYVLKLCRLCITDICNNLIELSNLEAENYHEYKKCLSKLKKDISPDNIIYNNYLILELKKEISKTKVNYHKYSNLYNKMKLCKLYTKACIVCNQTKTDYIDPYS